MADSIAALINAHAGIKAAAPTPAPVTAGVGGVRGAIADKIRAVGTGFNVAANEMGTRADKTLIYPVETAYAAGKVLDMSTTRLGPVHKVTGFVGKGVGFIGGFWSMIESGMLRAPGNVARDLANGTADLIDGGHTLNGDFGFGFAGVVPGSTPTAATQAAMGAGAVATK